MGEQIRCSIAAKYPSRHVGTRNHQELSFARPNVLLAPSRPLQHDPRPDARSV
jgi:hypothetical protein